MPLTPSGSGRVSVCASAELHAPPPNEDHEDSAEDEDEDDEESSPMLTSISKAAWMPASARAREKQMAGTFGSRFWFRFVSGSVQVRLRHDSVPSENNKW